LLRRIWLDARRWRKERIKRNRKRVIRPRAIRASGDAARGRVITPAALDAFENARRGLPQPEVVRGHIRSSDGCLRRANLLMAPDPLNLSSNFGETLGFLYEQRYRYFIRNDARGKPRVASVDLTKVKSLDLAAGLAMVAEYHRALQANASTDFRPYIDDETWDPDVRILLRDLGLYELVRARNRPESDSVEHGIRFVPFRVCDSVDGSVLDPLIEDIRTAAGRAPKRLAVYGALMEAVKNAIIHAYPDEAQELRVDPLHKLWWAAGAYFPDDDTLEFVVYDQGIGIPGTLTKKSLWEAVRDFCPPEFTDADVIAGALELGRTSTKRLERGNGLWTICRLASELPGSQVRIMSGTGDVLFAPGKTRPVRKKSQLNPFCGTLIHWSLVMPTDAHTGSQQ
jgi:hypothetical protein